MTSESLLPTTGIPLATGWDSAAGHMLIVPVATDPVGAAVVLPGLVDSTLASTSHFELTELEGVPVDLFNQKGFVGNSVLHVASQMADATGCLNWPMGKLATPVLSGWKVGLERGRASGIPLSPFSEMKGKDSAQFMSEVLAAAAHISDTGDPVFRGLPYSVRRGYRFVVSSSLIVLAEVVRKINEEANPREEHILFLAEQGRSKGVFRVEFSSRSAGAEESLETSDALAALQLIRPNRPAIVITFDYEDGGRVAILERIQGSGWKITWESAYTGC